MLVDVYLDRGDVTMTSHGNSRNSLKASVEIRREGSSVTLSGDREGWERMRAACEAALMEISLAASEDESEAGRAA